MSGVIISLMHLFMHRGPVSLHEGLWTTYIDMPYASMLELSLAGAFAISLCYVLYALVSGSDVKLEFKHYELYAWFQVR